MMRSNYYGELHWLASRYANRPDIVQGAGGNISVKIGDVMLVKASGREFRDIGDEGRGLIPVFYKKLTDYLSHVPQGESEEALLDVVLSSTEGSAGNERPSMEVWFHTLLSTYVLHTHSAYVNILGCSYESSPLFAEIMEKTALSWSVFPYYNPGFELGEVMFQRLSTLKNIPSVIFLENHGIIITSNSAKECVEMHDILEEKIKEQLAVTDAVFDMSDLSEKEMADFNSLVLFPDQIIYPEHRAVQAAHRFILKNIKRSDLTVRVIPEQNVGVVKNMESEKYRKNL